MQDYIIVTTLFAKYALQDHTIYTHNSDQIADPDRVNTIRETKFERKKKSPKFCQFCTQQKHQAKFLEISRTIGFPVRYLINMQIQCDAIFMSSKSFFLTKTCLNLLHTVYDLRNIWTNNQLTTVNHLYVCTTIIPIWSTAVIILLMAK